MTQHAAALFSLGAFADSGLKKGAENSDEGLGLKTTAKIHKNKQIFWHFSGAVETKMRNLRDLDQKGRLEN